MMCMQGGIYLAPKFYGASCSSGTLAGTNLQTLLMNVFPYLLWALLQCRVCGPIGVWQVNWVIDLKLGR